MFCKHCGMESTTPNVCSWCRHPLTAASSDAGARQPSVPPARSRPSPPPPISRSVPVQFAQEEPDEPDAAGPEPELEVTAPWNASPPPPPAAPPTRTDVPGPAPANLQDRQASRPIIGVRGRPSPVQPQGVPPPPVQQHGTPPPPIQRSPSAPPPPIVRSAQPGQPQTPPPAAPRPDSAPPPPIVRSTTAPPPPIIRQAPGTASTSAPAPASPLTPEVPSSQGSLPPLASQPAPQNVRVPAPPTPRGPIPRSPAPPGSPPPSIAQPVVPPASQPVQQRPVQQQGVAPPGRPQTEPQPPLFTSPPVAPRGAQPGPMPPIPPRSTPGAPPAAIPANTISMPAAQRPAAPSRQPQNLEPDSEEKYGLAHGQAVSNRPVIPSVADLHIRAAQSSTNSLVQSKYYQGQLVDATSQTMYDAASGRVTSAPPIPGSTGPPIIFHWDEPQDDIGPLVVKFLASFGGILLVCGLIAGFLPDAFVAPLCIATFMGGMLLPVFRLIPWQDEDSDDAVYLLLLLLVFGPAIGLVIYGAICLLRQEANVSVIACLSVAFVTRIVLELSAQHGFTMVMLNPPWVAPPTAGAMEQTTSLVANIFTSWTSLLAMAGWYVANIFHKEDE